MKNPILLLLIVLACGLRAEDKPVTENGGGKEDKKIEAPTPSQADPKHEPPEGEDASRVQVANLIYAGVRSSVCFSDHFLLQTETDSSISTSRRFHPVKSSSDELFKHPFALMTGEGSYALLENERANLKKYLENGGFLLASASCSSPEWDRAFRSEMGKLFPDKPLKAIPLSHKLFKTVYDIKAIQTKHGAPKPIEGIEINGRIAVVYSADGLNSTAHVHGCCCCGGNEIVNCDEINVNILAYALTH
ncbi:MAG: DUF4159 domain-containing protein [Planctomycetota bacterium]|nr:DUF4159 domain-containing protein [Planctomycetota bacterium]